jgi:molecular chaperone Hsp33
MSGLLPADDIVLPFLIAPLGVRGRLIRLGTMVDEVVRQHDYPAPVSALLAETMALTGLLGSALKVDGKFILQTRSDGPVDMLVADYTSPGLMRGYARHHLEPATGAPAAARLIGRGHLAMTIDQGPDNERYQGIVALEGAGLSAAAHTYFTQSEQIPTRLKLAAGQLLGRGGGEAASWRAGAIMVQHLPANGGASPLPLTSGEGGDDEASPEDDRWVKARLLLDTVEDHELLDPLLAPERLLYRLFHEDGVRVFPTVALARHCTCSRERIADIIARFTAAERADMLENGNITATCEFCSARYVFGQEEFAAEE